MLGMTQKALKCDFFIGKNAIIRELKSLSGQIEAYLKQILLDIILPFSMFFISVSMGNTY